MKLACQSSRTIPSLGCLGPGQAALRALARAAAESGVCAPSRTMGIDEREERAEGEEEEEV